MCWFQGFYEKSISKGSISSTWFRHVVSFLHGFISSDNINDLFKKAFCASRAYSFSWKAASTCAFCFRIITNREHKVYMFNNSGRRLGIRTISVWLDKILGEMILPSDRYLTVHYIIIIKQYSTETVTSYLLTGRPFIFLVISVVVSPISAMRS